MNNYDEEGRKFLRDNKIKFNATLTTDNKCPMWDDEKHIHGDEYRVTFSRVGKRFIIRFWNSKRDSEEGNEPTPYDVLTCLTKSDPGTFDNFCAEYGYETDSRRAEKAYTAVVKEWGKVKEFFTGPEIELLQEIN